MKGIKLCDNSRIKLNFKVSANAYNFIELSGRRRHSNAHIVEMGLFSQQQRGRVRKKIRAGHSRLGSMQGSFFGNPQSGGALHF